MSDWSDFNIAGPPQGWQCPVCRRVYSPTTPMCYYCGNEKISMTTTTNSEMAAAYEKETNSLSFEPTWNDGTPFCGKCGSRLENKNRIFDGWRCSKCEAIVKWRTL